MPTGAPSPPPPPPNSRKAKDDMSDVTKTTTTKFQCGAACVELLPNGDFAVMGELFTRSMVDDLAACLLAAAGEGTPEPAKPEVRYWESKTSGGLYLENEDGRAKRSTSDGRFCVFDLLSIGDVRECYPDLSERPDLRGLPPDEAIRRWRAGENPGATEQE